jgi:hypothetical protein
MMMWHSDVAGNKSTMIARDQILKKIKRLAGLPNLKDDAKLGHVLTIGILDRSTTKIGETPFHYIHIYYNELNQKGEAHGFDPQTSSPYYAFTFMPKPTCQRPLLLSMPTKIT